MTSPTSSPSPMLRFVIGPCRCVGPLTTLRGNLSFVIVAHMTHGLTVDIRVNKKLIPQRVRFVTAQQCSSFTYGQWQADWWNLQPEVAPVRDMIDGVQTQILIDMLVKSVNYRLFLEQDTATHHMFRF